MRDEITWQVAARTWFEGLPANHNAYALVDMASVHQAKRDVLGHLKARLSTNILQDDRPDASAACAWLMPLRPGTQGQRDFATSLAWAGGSACVTWLASTLAHQAFTQALHDRTKAELPDRYPVLLRCYDPRVLPEIHAVLTPAQAHTFWALDGTWCYVDRGQHFHQIKLPALSFTRLPPLQLDQSQTDRLLSAAEVDQVMPELVQESADAFLSIPFTERAAFTKRALNQASAHGLESLADRVMYCILALELGEDFASHPEWQPVMQLVQTRQLSLPQAIAQATQT